MFFRHTDLPFEKDDLSRFLPWLMAFMVFLAVLATAGSFVFNDLVRHWDQGVSNTLTVQLPSTEDPRIDEDRVLAALKLLRATKGIETADAITPEEVETLLRPWLGEAFVADELPLPRLISVEFDRSAGIDVAELRRQLERVAPGVAVDDHRVWLDGLIRAIRSAELIASIVLVLIALVTVGTVIFTTRAGLGLHKEVIEVLHLIGAQDSYIAGQFATRAFWLGLQGGIFGLLLAAPTLLALDFLGSGLQSGLIPDISLSSVQWAGLALAMPVVAAIATVTARVTVLKTLARMV